MGGSRELMYDINSGLIAFLLLVLMLGAMWIGNRRGLARHARENEESRSQTLAVQGSLLGVLALLLGFTFSLALARYDDRSRAVVDEANAIGTAQLRADLLPDELAVQAGGLFNRYIGLRIAAGAVAVVEDGERASLLAEAEAVFAGLWELAMVANEERPGPASVAFASALNDMIDSYAVRDAALDRHVPEIVLMLLYLTFVFLGAILGYAAGVTGIRPGPPVHAMVVLIVMLVFVIVDLDRPRRGLIAVDQSALLALAP